MNGQDTDLVWLFYGAMLKPTQTSDTANKVRTFLMNVQSKNFAKVKNDKALI